MHSKSQKLYYSFGEETEVKVKFCDSGLKDNWNKLFFKPLKWIVEKTTFDPKDVNKMLDEYKLENITKNGVVLKKYILQNWLGILEESLIEYPFKTRKDFLDKYFENDEEYTTFYNFLSYLSSIEEEKTHNGYIKLVIKE